MMQLRIESYTDKDIDRLAQIHLAASRGYMNSQMGINYIKAFLRWFLTYPETITLKVTFEGDICAYSVGAPVGYGTAMNRALLKVGVLGILTHPRVVLHSNFKRAASARLRLLFGQGRSSSIVKRPEGRCMWLVGDYVDPQHSGRGIGKAMMAAFEERARAMGMDHMRATVYQHNDAARAVHKKLGWEVYEQEKGVLKYYKGLDKDATP